MSLTTNYILVADNDPKFLNQLKTEKKADFALIAVSSEQDARHALNDSNIRIAALVVNPLMGEDLGIALIRDARKSRPLIQVFCLNHLDDPIFSTEQSRELGISGFFAKSITTAGIAEQLSRLPSVELSEASAALIDADESEFISIPIGNFTALSRSMFDIYAKVGLNRFVKLLRVGDYFSTDRLESYFQKNVKSLYLSRSLRDTFLSHCDEVAKEILLNKNAAIKHKIRAVLKQGEVVIQFIRARGVNSENFAQAEKFVENVQVLANQVFLADSDAVQCLFRDLKSYDHAVGVTLFAGLLAQPLKIRSDKSLQVLGLASLFHDISLAGVDPAIQDEDESKMSPEQKAIYYAHPKKSMEILQKIDKIDPVILQGVAQHHERRNKKGFPDRLGAGLINRVSEIVGMSDELIQLLSKNVEGSATKILADLEYKIFHGFSLDVVDATRKVLQKTNGQSAKAS